MFSLGEGKDTGLSKEIYKSYDAESLCETNFVDESLPGETYICS